MQDQIAIRGARMHNLEGASLSIKSALAVLSGLSASGRSTLAFDTLHREGQRVAHRRHAAGGARRVSTAGGSGCRARRHTVIIRTMEPEDLDFAAACTAAEGWASEIRAEFEGLCAHDAEGCLVAEEAGRRVGICVATCYGEYGFVGELIVRPEARGRGVGRRLLDRAVAHLHGRGAKSVLLDGVPAAVPLYERAGFRKVCRSLRLAGAVRGRAHPHVRPMQPADLAAVSALDEAAFAADRRFFLARRLSLYPALCRVLERDGHVAGYVMARPAGAAVAAGPWVVGPGAERAADLLEGLPAEGQVLEIGVGVLATNAAALAALRDLGFEERQDPPWRMLLGESAQLGASPWAYANGSAAKG